MKEWIPGPKVIELKTCLLGDEGAETIEITYYEACGTERSPKRYKKTKEHQPLPDNHTRVQAMLIETQEKLANSINSILFAHNHMEHSVRHEYA
jgi:hypothetical protein